MNDGNINGAVFLDRKKAFDVVFFIDLTNKLLSFFNLTKVTELSRLKQEMQCQNQVLWSPSRIYPRPFTIHSIYEWPPIKCTILRN